MKPDPLQSLGHDVFVEVLSHLPPRDLTTAELVCHAWRNCALASSSALWHQLCIRARVEPDDLYACEALAATGRWPVDEHDRRPIAADIYRLLCTPDHWGQERSNSATPLITPQIGTRVNWRYVYEEHVALQNAWHRAQARLRWITPPHNTVWRIKSVSEQNTLYCTSRHNGLVVVDRNTSLPLFEISGLDSYAHLEAGRGFACFNRPGMVDPGIGLNEDPLSNEALEVWRTSDARKRATLPRLGKSAFAESATSFTHRDTFRPNDPSSPLPRGHLEHYRTLQPPVRCHAFRLHVDGADSPTPRAVVAAAGSSAVFIWHLEEDAPMDKIDRTWEDIGRANYIELDDHFVFVCLERQMHVYSRETKRHIVSFPPIRSVARDAAAVAVPLSLAEDFKAIPDLERKARGEKKNQNGIPAPIGRAHVTGALRGEPGFDEAIARGIERHPHRVRFDRPEDIEYEFTACHYTSKHLICTTKIGAVFVIENYVDAFLALQSVPAEERAAGVAASTLIIGLATPIRQLTTYRDHIILCSTFNIIVLDSNDIPEIPTADTPHDPPMLRAHVLLGNHPQGMNRSSCIQADARSLYVTYYATGQMEAIGTTDDGGVGFPPHEAVEGLGVCVKVWTFGNDVVS